VAPPDLHQLTRLLENAYTTEDVLEMEGELLMTLEFRLNVVTVYTFLPDFMTSFQFDPLMCITADHLAYRTLADYEFHFYLPSLMAMTISVLTLMHYQKPVSWEWVELISGYTPGEIQPILLLLQKSHLKRRVNILRSQEKEFSEYTMPTEA
jgi:cyclin B